jgi:hypothetical protein
MTHYLYSVDVRNVRTQLKDRTTTDPTQEELHMYVTRELNFLKGQMTEDMLEISHIMAVPFYGESVLDILF